jgi:7-cyano-7-deazaguanine reductase
VSHDLPLGKTVDVPDRYSPEVLRGIPRAEAREELGIGESLPFGGYDIWNAWELSWLDPGGRPRVAIGELTVPCESPNLIESKSLKLYLDSLNQMRHASLDEVGERIQEDLSGVAGASVRARLSTLTDGAGSRLAELPGTCIDEEEVSPGDYLPDPELLKTRPGDPVSETLHSHLLKSNCRITGQPDWASLLIRYRGRPIDRGALLLYVISFRNYRIFQEPCVERIFVDLLRRCEPSELTVHARYTRRGGLDINPFRSNFEPLIYNARLLRQ